MVTDAGSNLLGFPLGLPLHREDLTPASARRIMARLPHRVSGVLITYLTGAADILQLMSRIGVRIVQLHSEIPPDQIELLCRRRGDIRVIKSLIVAGDNPGPLLAQMRTYAPLVSAFLTDTYDAASSASGATGKTHNWDLSRELVRQSPRPVILAGGLTPENVQTAIRHVQPAGVDAHTGLEGRDGRKDAGRVRRFVAAARHAFARLPPPGPGIIF